MRLSLYLRSARDYVQRAEYRDLGRRAASLVRSESASVVVHKELSQDSGATDPRRQPPIRPASLEEVLALVATPPRAGLDADELWERRLRQHIATTMGVDGCFVADAADAHPAFMQYLFTADDNDRLRSSFSGLFPMLGANEAMVEFLYIAPASRNPGFAVSCLQQVTDEARRLGATSVVSCIDPGNAGALFVNHLAGFRARSVRRNRVRLFRRTYSFEDWPADTSRSLIDVASGKVRIA